MTNLWLETIFHLCPHRAMVEGAYFLVRLTRYEIANKKPIAAYTAVKMVIFAGINKVKTPRDAAENTITRATYLSPRALLLNLEFCHILPARAIKVIAIIRIDQTI